MKKNKKRQFTKPTVIGVLIAIGFFLIFGGIAAIIQNPWFMRMTPVGFFEWFSLIITSLLLGLFFGLHALIKQSGLKKCNAFATTGGILGFLTFGCSVCNKILILVLGVTGILTYFEPLRPILGVLSIGFLVYANIVLWRTLQNR